MILRPIAHHSFVLRAIKRLYFVQTKDKTVVEKSMKKDGQTKNPMFINGIGDQNLPGNDYLFDEVGECDYNNYSSSKKSLVLHEGG